MDMEYGMDYNAEDHIKFYKILSYLPMKAKVLPKRIKHSNSVKTLATYFEAF